MKVSEAFHNSWESQNANGAAALLHYRDQLVRSMEAGKQDMAGFYKALIVRMLCLKPKTFRKLTPSQLIEIADDLKFIHDPWYSFHVTYIRTRMGTLYRPATRLMSLTFWQFIRADAEYSKFLILNFRESEEQYQALDRLIAILYQTEPGLFDDHSTDEFASCFPYALTFDMKYLILHTYSNCRKYIMNERCPSLFPSSSARHSDEPIEPTYTGAQWQKLLFDLSETTAFAGLENAKSAMLYDALDYMEKKAKEMLNTKRR
jgi:hypothetical protein